MAAKIADAPSIGLCAASARYSGTPDSEISVWTSLAVHAILRSTSLKDGWMRLLSRQAAADHIMQITQLGAARNSLRAVVLVLALCLAACATQTSTRFDSTLWKAQRGVSDDANRRSVMVEGVLAVLKPGMTRGEVIAQLGEPDGTNEDHSADLYALGFQGVGIDQMSLQIFYESGKLKSTLVNSY